VSFNQFAVIAVIALAVTIPTVILIPRARQSVAFDRLLWVGTFVIAFLGSWAALGYIGPDSSLAALNSVVFADTRILTVLVGALASALFLNMILWVMDRFSLPSIDDEDLGDDGVDDYSIPPQGGLEQPLGDTATTRVDLEQPLPEPQDLTR
jgi:hypothetical protein